ncbi:hypothetical protein FHS19_000156 [Paenibacillus rhizosphaerae]|uniref:Uncharacterized protein n=1 Tax=Paenibacillus rhizosphaerae TaxID=297318 RepID=A0A839TFW6_9BACL|nr:hypothetical protein [Paenibacillus rhizosphaerae]MBB3125502.1 hypothetical protein [Paenibacillus rhizosphaerae]
MTTVTLMTRMSNAYGNQQVKVPVSKDGVWKISGSVIEGQIN